MSDLFQVDAADADRFATAMATVPAKMSQRLQRVTNGLLSYGVVQARAGVNSRSGRLAGNIRILQPASVGTTISGRYGVRKADVVYARMRERGGVITAKRAKYLHFQVNGRWVKVKSVRQRGSWYMRKSREALKPRIRPAFSRAIRDVLAEARS